MIELRGRSSERQRVVEPGPWDHEPDEVLWTDETTGLPCILRRGMLLIWCGYVGIARPHRKIDEDDLRVHGGITGTIHPDQRSFQWAVAFPALNWEQVDWFGFDCGHLGDYMPSDELGMKHRFRHRDAVYRDQEYAMDECGKLARQLKRFGDIDGVPA